ncbi:GABA permease [Bacillus pseudomycoides]|uniref:GABA permease n=2 Tax=Bacillus TaxID=1386 RepID=A0AA91VDX9_9BACI|nr:MULTISPECIES: amino acid permease [unclassified Bacillus (in: firmicutes)]PED83413.1 GABA permease [Bacillus pseudomycoides]PEB56967.1 GABA permease [Bacillus sp. AFS098217]PEU14955.1 GABA permease [Bacillus sp. AFS014408]PEU15331.1 GABA permease [Bacillus sp. AFS019443]PFW61075.1 GABA permease [Bacillus sp. AFS075034]
MANVKNELQKELKTRHITMISIGGVIGAGLFVGSGTIIRTTGPGAILSYIIGALIVVLVMRMLGEMAAENPDSGSFSTYAHKAIGPWAGYTIGWLYWFNWVIIVAIEAVLLGAMINNWFPSIPAWIASVSMIILMTITNIYSVKLYGEFEYWLALIKVTAILVFLGLGIAMIIGIVPGVERPSLSIISENGGFFPNGILPVFLSVVFISFSLSGSEVAAIAAGESENPEKNVIKAINAVVWRLMLFFVGSVSILVIFIPWNNESLLQFPYASLFHMAGIPAAAEIMNGVVFLSLLSVLNSGLYTSSRMLFSLSKKGDAPKVFSKLNSRGAPIWAILASILFAFICAMLKFLSPDKLFAFLANSSGGVTMLMYMFVAVSHIKLRRIAEKEGPEKLKVKMWLFPYLTYVTLCVIVAIFVSQVFIEDMRMQFYLTLLATAIVIVSYFWRFRNGRIPVKSEKTELDELTMMKNSGISLEKK